MKLDELYGPLREPYSEARGFGIARDDNPKYANINFVVPPPPPRQIPKNLPLNALRAASTVLVRMSDFEESGPDERLASHFFVRREAVQSSRMEGTWSTLDDVLSPFDSLNQSSPGLDSVRGYALALERHFDLAHQQQESVFNEATVKAIHKDIVSRDPTFTGIAGKFRSVTVWIGSGRMRPEDSIYNPAPPKYIPQLFSEFINWISDKNLSASGDAGTSGFTLPVRLAIAHAHFEAIHTFSDGNGRVGRALWPLQMIAAGHMPLYLSGYVEAHRQDYSQTLQAAQKKLNYAPLVEFICQAIIDSDQEAKLTIRAMNSLPDLWKKRAKFRANSTAMRALELLIKMPIITADLLIAELGVSKQAAHVALNQLVERRIVRQRGRNGRRHSFAAEELIAILSRDFGADVETALEHGYQSLLAADSAI